MDVTRILLSMSFVGLSGFATAAEVNPVTSRTIPSLLDSQEVSIVTVEYAAGESTPAHRHHAHTFVYVLEGEIIMQVAGGEAVTLKAGQNFYENPHDVHVVSKNASATETAKFLVFFIKTPGAPATVME